ncbi:MAG: exodeoxyribonuclease III [Gammaproteobacteria bacterium]|nr:exodeoxyribonuclease III [Gammaproteobacteria bacterium]
MHLATWNVNSLQIRLSQVLMWLTQSAVPIDVLVLQEIKMVDEKFPHADFNQIGYQCASLGQKSYNGVAIISRHPITDIQYNLPHYNDASARLISATICDVRLLGAYFPNGQSPDSDKFQYKMQWLESLQAYSQETLDKYEQAVLLGDFNITLDDLDVWDPVKLEGAIHCTQEERAHLHRLLNQGWCDSGRIQDTSAKQFTWWDYRHWAFQKNLGLRIDHIYVSARVASQLKSYTIHKAERKHPRPSDHVPVSIVF